MPRGARTERRIAIGAVAIGALAVGAFAVGALAIGRLAIGKAIIGVVVAELFGARAGLGYQITISSQAYDTAGLFAAVGILAVAGVGLSAAVQLLENALAPWRRA